MSPKVIRIIFVPKSLVFMRFSSIFINLLEIVRIISFVFDLKYLSQNLINFNRLGGFWIPQDEQFGFAFRATFEGDIEAFRPVKVMLANTV